MPESRRYAATTRLPRAWPSSPILVTITLGGRSDMMGLLQQLHELARQAARRLAAACSKPEARPVERAEQHQPQQTAVGRGRQRQFADQFAELALVFGAQGFEPRRSTRDVGREHAYQHLREIASLPQGLELRCASRFEPRPGV